jgi:hypothetical protein
MGEAEDLVRRGGWFGAYLILIKTEGPAIERGFDLEFSWKLDYADEFYQSVAAVIVRLLLGCELDLARDNCINSIVASHFNSGAGHVFAAALSDDYIARNCCLAIRKLHA